MYSCCSSFGSLGLCQGSSRFTRHRRRTSHFGRNPGDHCRQHSLLSAAFGGAVGLVACCDIAIASDKASFCLSEVKIGLMPAVISPYVVRAIGERASRRYFLTAERFFAAEALHLGLLHQLVSDDELHGVSDAMVQTLLTNGPAAVKAAKNLIFTVANQPTTQALIDETSRPIAQIRVSSEGQEGLSAFLQKRTPAWQLNDSDTGAATDSKGQA